MGRAPYKPAKEACSTEGERSFKCFCILPQKIAFVRLQWLTVLEFAEVLGEKWSTTEPPALESQVLTPHNTLNDNMLLRAWCD